MVRSILIQQAILVLATCLICAPIVHSASKPENPQLTVVVYDAVEASQQLLRPAEEEASRVLRLASLDVEWVNCSGEGGDKVECRQLSDANEIVLRVVPRALTLGDSALGAAFLSNRGEGRYADIFAGAADALHVQNQTASRSRVLGDVMTHEIGHLLLGSQAHSSTGIMRPHWTSKDLRDIAMGRLVFTPDQCRRVRERVEKRNHALGAQVASLR